ncbi:MAG: acetoacetate decarboxylase family protein, partial [Vulcanimicrobiaceae bacterium]
SQGMLWYKYVPRTGNPDVADAAYPVLWPHTDSHMTVDKYFTADGTVRFARVTWEDLPFMYHVVNALAGLDLVEFRGASLTLAHGGSDFSGSRILE